MARSFWARPCPSCFRRGRSPCHAVKVTVPRLLGGGPLTDSERGPGDSGSPRNVHSPHPAAHACRRILAHCGAAGRPLRCKDADSNLHWKCRGNNPQLESASVAICSLNAAVAIVCMQPRIVERWFFSFCEFTGALSCVKCGSGSRLNHLALEPALKFNLTIGPAAPLPINLRSYVSTVLSSLPARVPPQTENQK